MEYTLKTFFKCYFDNVGTGAGHIPSKSPKLRLDFADLDLEVEEFRQLPDTYLMSWNCDSILTGQAVLWQHLRKIRSRVENLGGRFELLTSPGMVDECEASGFKMQRGDSDTVESIKALDLPIGFFRI